MGHSFDDHLLARSLPAPYQLAIEGLPFQLTVLGADGGDQPHDSRHPIAAGTQFALALAASTNKRFLYLVQKTAAGVVERILLCDRRELAGEPPALGLRVPPAGAWLRAVVDGRVHVMASDLELSQRSILAWIGGCEPPAQARI